MKFSGAYTTSLLALSSLGPTLVAAQDETKCPCLYQGPRETDCYIYSADLVTAYPKADDICLEELNLLDRFLPADDFWRLCPNPNETDYNIDAFINLVRFQPDNPVSQDVKSRFIVDMDTTIFVEVGNGTYVLPDEIVTPLGLDFNCTEQENFCWNVVKTEFTGRFPRFRILCGEFHDTAIPEFYAEQAAARQALCGNNGSGLNATAKDACQEVLTAVSGTSCGSVTSQVVANATFPFACPADDSGDSGVSARALSWAATGLVVTIVGLLW
jgi:hypothetical protein